MGAPAVVDHPNRPSAALARYRSELHAQAQAAEHTGSTTQPAVLRAVASRVTEIGLAAECQYEAKVCDLVYAALDVLNGGGFNGDREHALHELRVAVNNVRFGHTTGHPGPADRS